jgi:hypothetical protein
LVCWVVGSFAWAQIPQQINYQGKLVNGTNLVTRTVNMIIGIYPSPTGGLPLYLDSNYVSVVDGFYSTIIGDGTISGSLTNALASGTAYVDIMVDGFTLSPRDKITSTAYALNALSAPGSGWNLTGNSGTAPGNFLGTTDNQPLVLQVNNQRVARMEPGTGPNVVLGYLANTVTAGAASATIGGGGLAGAPQRVSDRGGTVSGGAGNLAGNASGTEEDAPYATVGGGYMNAAYNDYSTISGGQGNTVTNLADGGTIGGGSSNLVSEWHATVAGGIRNVASGSSSAIGGGSWNQASGNLSVIPGGFQNQALGIASFAAGNKAQALHDYAFVWSDASGPCNSVTSNTFVARASSGFTFYTATGTTFGAQLAAGAGAWNTLSDRESKKDFQSVDPQEVLEKLSRMPVMTWSWVPEDPASRHMGPVAQDFRSAFGLGNDERHINTADADGVALAAIQGLYQVVKEKDAKIQELEARLSVLEQVLLERNNPK